MKFAIILSGCGNRDGSELQETLSLMLAIDRRNASYQCFAPEGLFTVVPHVDSRDDEEEEGDQLQLADMEQRDIFVESARLCRGDILPIEAYSPEEFDALLLPGGMGAARNLSTYAFDGHRMEVIDSVHDAILSTYRDHKPVGAMCIAPMLLAKTLGRYGIEITLGADDNHASADARSLGCRTTACGPTEICVDDEHKIVTTPAYMAASRIGQIFDGADSLVEAVSKMVR